MALSPVKQKKKDYQVSKLLRENGWQIFKKKLKSGKIILVKLQIKIKTIGTKKIQKKYLTYFS